MFTFAAPPELEAALLDFYREKMGIYSKAEVDAKLAALFQGPTDPAVVQELREQITALTQRVAALELIL